MMHTAYGWGQNHPKERNGTMVKVTAKKTGEVINYETKQVADFWIKAMVQFNNMRHNNLGVGSRDSKRNYLIEEL